MTRVRGSAAPMRRPGRPVRVLARVLSGMVGRVVGRAVAAGIAAIGIVAVGLVGLAGCADRGPSTRDVARALGDQAWPGGTVEVPRSPGGRAYGRPTTARSSAVAGAPWQAVADEVGRAVDAGWVPVYAQCAGPRDSVRVDLVRALDEKRAQGAIAVATVATVPSVAGGFERGEESAATTTLTVEAVAPAAQDLADPVLLPDALRAVPQGIDPGACLDGPPAHDARTWVGSPAWMPATGGPLPR